MNLILSTILLSFILISCGRGSKNSDAFEREEETTEPDTLQRLYRGDVRPVNPSIIRNIKGQVAVRLIGDEFEVNIAVSEVPSSTHPQRLLTGKNCPTQSADADGDGIISPAEAQAVSGEVFIPFDSDIENLGESNFPVGGLLGAYNYRETASRSRLLANLGPGVEYDLENRVLMIYGTDDDRDLPIGCAELFQVLGQE